MAEWFENESFWKETYDFLFPEKLFTETNEQVESILKLVGFNGSSILDLCCGPGRCSIALAKKGFSVTGVDLSQFLLDKARKRAKSVPFLPGFLVSFFLLSFFWGGLS